MECNRELTTGFLAVSIMLIFLLRFKPCFVLNNYIIKHSKIKLNISISKVGFEGFKNVEK
jgi:hypothetical protein